MANKKPNSGGKKFQGRQPGEKRARVVSKPKPSHKFKTDDRPKKSTRFSADNPEKFEKKEKFTNERKTFGAKNKFNKETDNKKPGFKSFKKREETNKPEFNKKREKTDSKTNFKGSKRQLKRTNEKIEKTNDLKTQEIRLNRYIANTGKCSRREADELIKQGLISVNGKVITVLGTKVMPGDLVKIDNQKVSLTPFVYLLLNKPKGYITTTNDPEGRKTVMELIDIQGRERFYPVGRLDRNTTGVLLLTNDGELAQKMTHPSFKIKKIYKVKLDKKPSKEHMLDWVNGVILEDGRMSFEQIGFVDDEDQTVLGLEVHSGKNRVVRRMFEHFQYEVKSLDRVLFGDFDKMKLGRGKWRFLNEKEIKYIERIKRK